MFKSHQELLIRNDLIDCRIDICSIEVPALFTENFDYQDMRHDFLRGILESELLGKTIFCHLTQGYAASASTQQTYDAISKDVLNRWTYPLVPDNFHLDSTYSHIRPNIYKGKHVLLAPTAVLKELVAVGPGTHVGEHSLISHSVLGRNCVVGTHVKIFNSYIFDNVVIKDYCDLSHCIIGSDVYIRLHTTVPRGCILGYSVTIGPNIELPQRTKIVRMDGMDSGSESSEVKGLDLGVDVVGTVYNGDFDDGKGYHERR